MDHVVKTALDIVKDIQSDIPGHLKPPAEGLQSDTDQVIPVSYVKKTRGYIAKLVNQINGCYEKGWFDACAVMVRHLCENLIIEVYEANGMVVNIKDANGNYYMMDGLVNRITSEATWTLNKSTRKVLPKVTESGNRSAHGIRFNAHRADVDELISDLRVAVQELLVLAKIKP